MSATATRLSKKRPAPQVDESSHHKNNKRIRHDSSQRTPPKANSNTATTSSQDTLQIQEETGDIFDAPANALIIHACNCNGSWGGGIAKAFKARYPSAYERYAKHCEKHGHALLDSAQLIVPGGFHAGSEDPENAFQDEGFEDESTTNAQEAGPNDSKTRPHFVGCLFTSRNYGRNKDTPGRILKATTPAMMDLLSQVKDWNAKAAPAQQVGEVRMCKINSGLFAVPWEKTKSKLESIDVRDIGIKSIKVVSPPD